MAIKLQVYLKRTNQTLSSWMDANEVSSADDLLSRCAFKGLAGDMTDVAEARLIFEKRRELKKIEPVESSVVIEQPEIQAIPPAVKTRKRKPDPALVE